MELMIKKITVENFRNHIAEKKFNFEDGLNIFQGENGIGKTSLLSAITWCIFGYDIYSKNVQNFSIYPIIDDEEQVDLKPRVEVEFSNGTVLKRLFSKDKTHCSIGNYDGEGKLNFVSYTQKEYKRYIEDKIIKSETWEMLSNLEKLPKMKWQELKELIFNLVGGINDDVIFANDDYSLIENDIRSHGVEQIEISYKQTRTSIKDDIENRNALIKRDQETKEELTSSGSLEEIQDKKKALDIVVEEYQDQNQKNEEIRAEITNHKNEVNQVESDINNFKVSIERNNETIDDYKDLYKKAAFDEEKLRKTELESIDDDEQKLKRSITNIEFSINDIQIKIDRNNTRFDNLTNDNVELLNEGKELQKVEIKLESTTCDLCGQELPEDVKAKTLENLKQKNIDKQTDVMTKVKNNKAAKSEITTENENYQTQIDNYNVRISEINDEIKGLDTKREEVNNKVYDKVEVTDQQQEIQNKIDALITKNDSLKSDKETSEKKLEELNQKVLPELKELSTPQETIDEKEKLAIQIDKIITADNDIKENTNELKGLGDRLNTIENKLQLLVKFKSSKSQMITEKIQSEFDMVEFITSEVQKDGQTVETFKLAFNGVEFRDLSTAEKIKVSHDLVSNVQKLKGICIPIIIDNLESVTDLGKIKTQIIAAKVVEQDVPQINLISGEKTVKIIVPKEVEVGVDEGGPDKHVEVVTEIKPGEPQMSLNFDDEEA